MSHENKQIDYTTSILLFYIHENIQYHQKKKLLISSIAQECKIIKSKLVFWLNKR